MDFELKVVENGKVGLVKMLAPVTKELFCEVIQCIIKYKVEHDLNLLIYDVRNFPLQLSAFEQYDFVYNLTGYQDTQPSHKIVLWIKKEDHSYDFIETLYLNSGRCAKRFDAYDEALHWLTGE